jgi:hypothetical protein
MMTASAITITPVVAGDGMKMRAKDKAKGRVAPNGLLSPKHFPVKNRCLDTFIREQKIDMRMTQMQQINAGQPKEIRTNPPPPRHPRIQVAPVLKRLISSFQKCHDFSTNTHAGARRKQGPSSCPGVCLR